MDQTKVYFAKDRNAWWKWLSKNHTTKQAVWLKYDKGAKRKLSYDDIVEVALCFGWIDSKTGRVSDTQSKVYISKRKPKSAWSKSNKARVRNLIEQKLMQPAGLSAIEIAKQNGAWDALNESDKFIIPKEMSELLKENSAAANNYNSFSNSSKRIILEWVYAAKRPSTRQKRIEETVSLAAKGIKANHYRQ